MKNKYFNFNLENGVIPKYQFTIGNRGGGKSYFLNQLRSKEEQNERKQETRKKE